VWVHWPDVDGDWQTDVVAPDAENGVNVFPVTIENDIVFQGSGMHPGFMFDNGQVEDLLKPYIGENNLGESMFMYVNESKQRNGCYFVNRYECRPNGGTRAVCVEWELVSVIETNNDLRLACRGDQDEADRFAVNYGRGCPEDGHFSKRFHRPTDKWNIFKIVENEPEDHLACVDTERIADILIAMLNGPVIAVHVEDGQVQGMVCPYDFPPTVQMLVVQTGSDLDTRDSRAVEFTSENGEEQWAHVYQPALTHPVGANDVDRAIQSFYHAGPGQENGA